jgi:5-methylcytosine-specific restriction protein B
MDNDIERGSNQPGWLVGASFGGGGDQTTRFTAEGIWEVRNPTERESALLRSMKPGERIAIKSSFTRKRGLPFANGAQTVSVIAIKAVGIIMRNTQDGERVDVQWHRVDPPREWYFFTYRATIWRLVPSEDWKSDALLDFAFREQAQDIERFRNAPFWRERFGTVQTDARRFEWTAFYQAVAERLLPFQKDRAPLIAGIHAIATRVQGLNYLRDKFADGTSGPLRDICPFTAMGTFNRSMTDANRRAIATGLAAFLGVDLPVPTSFEGIPVLNNQRSWFFAYETARGAGDIDALWSVFAAAAHMLDDPDDPESARLSFASDYDDATAVWGVAWNLSTGLYWAHPWDCLTLDSQSRHFVEKRLRLPISTPGPNRPCDGTGYLKLIDDLRSRFAEDEYPVHSFPELSLASWGYERNAADAADGIAPPDGPAAHEKGMVAVPDAVPTESRLVAYTVNDIVAEGCFMDRADIVGIMERLRTKKNLILQGPPGTGKTWLARRLAYALIGHRDDGKVRALQFHPTLSYEDFVRGWRPTGDGKLAMCDGVFMEAIQTATLHPSSAVVVVIEEINRGNPAQIFGELLTLLEDSKRTPSEALELSYPDPDGQRRPVHIPKNLYVIGTMNLADRSLALMDLALRRRFAFVSLEPRLGRSWRDWVVEHCHVDADRAPDIEHRIEALNAMIAGDARLGPQFRIGHSYVTPSRLEPGRTVDWFRQVVETEIGPLLEEYWFDAPPQAAKARATLLEGW